MFEFYINQDTLVLLSQEILILILLFYFGQLPNKSRAASAIMELVFVWGFMLFLLHTHLNAFQPSPHQGIIQIVLWGAVQWAPTSMFPFAYTFPTATSTLQREGKIVTRFAKGIVVAVVSLSLLCHWAGQGTLVAWLQTTGVLLGVSNALWIFVVMGRRIVMGETTPPRAWILQLWKPTRTEAVAIRNMAFALLLGLIAIICLALWGLGMLQGQIVRHWFTYTMTTSHVFVLVTYIHYSDEPFSFLIKLVGALLLTMLMILSFVGLLLAPTYTHLYRPMSTIQSQSQIRFQPNTQGAYSVQDHMFVVDADWGKQLVFEHNAGQPVDLPFVFPYYGQQWRQLTINRNGIITAVSPFALGTFLAHKQPAIVPMLTHFVADEGTIFVKRQPSSMTITWHNMISVATGLANTFQVVLHRDGGIDFIYLEIATDHIYSSDPLSGIWLVGLLPGNRTAITQQVRLFQDRAYTDQPGAAVVENYYLDFRRYLHQPMQRLAFLILGATLFILVGFPILFRAVLIQPFNLLVAAMRRVNENDLTVSISTRHNDEISFLATSFNQMVESLHKSHNLLEQSNARLEEQVQVRTAQLMERNEQLSAAKEDAEAANQAKSRFLTNVSHELRTPLNAILGFTQLLQQNSRVPTKEREQVTIVKRSGQHLLALINDLLDLAKIEANKFELTSDHIHLPNCIADVVTLMRVQATKKGLHLQYEPPTELPTWVLGDERRLHQVLLNLLSNAIKYTEQGQVALYITALPAKTTPLETDDSRLHQTQRLRFAVIDSGIGIAAEQLTTLFQPFTQLGDATQRSTGMGLGLAISARLVQWMGGKLQVESIVGQGSTFWFELELPFVEAERDVAAANNGQNRPIIGYHGRRKTILVVDDAPEIRLFLRDLLEPLGFHVILAMDGQEGMAQVQQSLPDLILLDLMMPVLDGGAVLTQLRQQPAWSEIPIILISATISPEDQVTLRAIEGVTFLLKPIDADLLCRHIASLLQLAWHYAEPVDNPATLAPTELILPPRTELVRLHQAALLGDIRAIHEHVIGLVAEDATYRLFAERIRHLAEEVEIEQILALSGEWLRAGE